MKLSITIYSFNRYFREGRYSVSDFVDFAKNEGFNGVDLGYYWRDESEKVLVKEKIKRYGLLVPCYITRNDFVWLDKKRVKDEVDKVRKELDNAILFGSYCLRVFTGHLKANMDYSDVRDNIIDAFKLLVKYAEEKKVKIALENHDGIFCSYKYLLDLLEAVNSQYLRINFDIGNFLIVDEDPLVALDKLYQYIVHVHVKDFQRKDNKLIGCTLGEGIVKVREIIKGLYDKGYKNFLSIEYEGYEDNIVGIRKSLKYLRKIIGEL